MGSLYCGKILYIYISMYHRKSTVAWTEKCSLGTGVHVFETELGSRV